MFTKLKLIYDAAMLVVSLFKKANEAYKNWKISQIEKAIQKRKEHLREQTGMDVPEFSNHVGIPKHIMDSIDKGVKNPSLKTLQKVADKLEFNLKFTLIKK